MGVVYKDEMSVEENTDTQEESETPTEDDITPPIPEDQDTSPPRRTRPTRTARNVTSIETSATLKYKLRVTAI